MKKIIISLGGSLIVPDKIDTVFLSKFKDLINKYASKLSIYNLSSAELSLLIEQGALNSPLIIKELALSLEPALKNHRVDVLALGCTHYSLVMPAIKKVIAPDIQIIDSSMVIIKQIKEILKSKTINQKNKGKSLYFTTGNTTAINKISNSLFNNRLVFHSTN